jgi:hypothetical protein
MKSGSCLCGAVTYEVHGPLRNVVACHGKQCRKQTGTSTSFRSVRGDHDPAVSGLGGGARGVRQRESR